MDIDWEAIRKEQFPALEKAIYLKAAGGSPISKTAFQAGMKYLNDMHNIGDLFWDIYLKEVDITRALVADYLCCHEDDIAFLINTSSCVNCIARLIEPGLILYPEGEFPASILPFKALGFNCEKINAQNENVYSIMDINKKISLNTKYLIHSHVQYLTGFRQNLDELGLICQENKIVNIINATQSFGAFPIDIKKQKIDMLVASGLKWACCGYGIGILYINNSFFKDSQLPFAGWLSVEDAFLMNNDNMKFKKKTKSLDGLGGTPNFFGIFSLKASLILIKEIGSGDIQRGIACINNRILELTSYFVEELKKLNLKIISPLDSKYRSGIITIENENARNIFNKLQANNIFISFRNYPNLSMKTLLRFSFNYYNNFEDIKKCIKVLKGILK